MNIFSTASARLVVVLLVAFFGRAFPGSALSQNGDGVDEARPIVPSEKPAQLPVIDFWYGDEQRFGHLGNTQPLVNVLGSITPREHIGDVSYQLNNLKRQQLRFGTDLHRLARSGDFNIELDRAQLKAGENKLTLRLHDLWGRQVIRELMLHYTPDVSWSLPCEVDFSKVENLQDVVEIHDGKWKLTGEGVRTAEPYYDRQFAFGDDSWTDYELHAEIIFHQHFPERLGRNTGGPPYLSHVHTSFNLRWGGHPDDGVQPRRAWQNLGSLVALRTDLATPKKGSYWWMHFGFGQKGKPAKRSMMEQEQRIPIELGKRYHYRMRAETIDKEGSTRYSTRVWADGTKEPDDWQMVAADQSETLASGAAVFVVHHSDVTLCRVRVIDLKNRASAE